MSIKTIVRLTNSKNLSRLNDDREIIEEKIFFSNEINFKTSISRKTMTFIKISKIKKKNEKNNIDYI